MPIDPDDLAAALAQLSDEQLATVGLARAMVAEPHPFAVDAGADRLYREDGAKRWYQLVGDDGAGDIAVELYLGDNDPVLHRYARRDRPERPACLLDGFAATATISPYDGGQLPRLIERAVGSGSDEQIWAALAAYLKEIMKEAGGPAPRR